MKWLCFEELPEDDIKKFYDNIQFVAPAKAHLAASEDYRKSIMVPPITKRRLLRKMFSVEDQAVWKKHGFEEIYLHRMGQADWSELGKILNHPVMRVALECCIIMGMDDETLTQLLPAVYTLPLSPNTIALFRKYFFDVADWGRNEWQTYLRLLLDDRYTYIRIFSALTKNKDEVLHLVGLPSSTQFGTMLKNIMNTAHYKFEHYARQGSEEAQDEARKWAKVLIDAGVKHDKYAATDATDFSSLIQTSFEYIQDQIETITPEMISEVKPQLQQSSDKGPDAPSPPDLTPPQRPENDV